jgi:beta-lactamase superfamily II metal-dependent hydrolase
MPSTLKVHAYNVLFGDCLLIEIPARQRSRFILIDGGNKVGKGGKEKPLLDALGDIHRLTRGRIDLYILSHEHMDHCKGLLLAARNNLDFRFDTLWLTASAAPDYYDKHPDARREKKRLDDAVRSLASSRRLNDLPLELREALDLNATTQEHVDHIRALRGVRYVHRKSRAAHPFDGVDIRILAPEEDTSEYYGAAAHALALAPVAPRVNDSVGAVLPLAGVDGGAFYDLVSSLDMGLGETAFLIDQAANNTSLVIELTWRRRRLLFTGDAELGSWRRMHENHQSGKKLQLKPVDFLKVGHHGSRNATPGPEVLDLILPAVARGQAQAVVSTSNGAYSGVPDRKTLNEIKRRTHTLHDTRDARVGKSIMIEIEGG